MDVQNLKAYVLVVFWFIVWWNTQNVGFVIEVSDSTANAGPEIELLEAVYGIKNLDSLMTYKF